MHTTIHTKRLLLRPVVATDIENIYRGLSHPAVIKHYGVSFHTLEATQEQMDWYANLVATGTGCWWAVCSLDGKTFYGGGGFNDLDKNLQKAEIGFWLLPEYWGNGYMTEAMPTICQYGFEHLNLTRIEGFVETENMNCKNALAKLNFELEKTMHDCEEKDGQLISVDVYVNKPT